jgi:plastocyanin
MSARAFPREQREGSRRAGVIEGVDMRKLVAVAAAAFIGTAVGIMPSADGSEAPRTIEAVNEGAYIHAWVPGTQTVGEGTTIPIVNKTSVVHGVEWKSPPEEPVCEGVPVGTWKTSWEGSCTFKKPGVYTFWCSYHGSAMKGTITVEGSGGTTSTGTTGTTGTTTGMGTGTITYPGSGSNSSVSVSPFVSTARSSVKISERQHGHAVRGSVDVSSAGAGGRLEVLLLARRAAVAAASSSRVRAGRIARTVAAGKVAFKVPLNAAARGALARRGSLALLVRLTLKPPTGSTAVVTRKVALHR